MIHPQYWSLYSVWCKLTGKNREAIGPRDIAAYKMLPCKGKTVLDVGAYDGDTAELYFSWGAEKVIAIETDASRCLKMKRNKKLKMPIEEGRLEIIQREAKPEDVLRPDVDCIKCDCEGFEMDLLDAFAKTGKPCVVEVHNWWIKQEFERKGFMLIEVADPMLGVCLMKNF